MTFGPENKNNHKRIFFNSEYLNTLCIYNKLINIKNICIINNINYKIIYSKNSIKIIYF